MAELDERGRRLLGLLVALLPTADPKHPEKMIGYKDAHDHLQLSNMRGNWGDSLKAQGLNNLAEWTKITGKPAITGIIVNQTDSSPGRGYFTLFDRADQDWDWWREQIAAAKAYDWKPHLSSAEGPKLPSNRTVRPLIQKILSEYATARNELFSEHEMADVIRDELPAGLNFWVNDRARYRLKGSPGQGLWAAVPWIAAIDSLVTNSVQNGYYVVYLFSADLSGVHLSLNQGVTSVKEQYGSGSTHALQARAQDFLSRLGNVVNGLQVGPIDLKSPNKSGLAPLYEAGSICSLFYAADELPSENVLKTDFERFMLLYADLAARDDRLFVSADSEEDESGLDFEDARKLREHKRIERNRRLAEKAKKIHGYICKVCGFDFEKSYGSIGIKFIEAHHLVPLAKLKGQLMKLDPQRDFTVLCSNCHRMIHRSDVVDNVEEFRLKHVSESD